MNVSKPLGSAFAGSSWTRFLLQARRSTRHRRATRHRTSCSSPFHCQGRAAARSVISPIASSVHCATVPSNTAVQLSARASQKQAWNPPAQTPQHYASDGAILLIARLERDSVPRSREEAAALQLRGAGRRPVRDSALPNPFPSLDGTLAATQADGRCRRKQIPALPLPGDSTLGAPPSPCATRPELPAARQRNRLGAARSRRERALIRTFRAGP